MRKIALPLLALSMAALVGCSKQEDPAKSAPTAAPAASAASAADKPVVRAATYDPNLKPGPVVWDSPEKKKRWEDAQRRAQAAQAGQAGQPAQAAPAQPSAPVKR